MRIARVLVLLMSIAIVATACGGGTASPTGAAATSAAAAASATPKPSPTKIVSSYGNVTPANLAPFMAKELGLFEKYNLSVDLSLINGGTAQTITFGTGDRQASTFSELNTKLGTLSGVTGSSSRIPVQDITIGTAPPAGLVIAWMNARAAS